MKNFNLEKEMNEHPYKYYGRVFEERHDDVSFLLRTALYYSIDAYDEYLGSVEMSHYEELGYNEVVNFNTQEPISSLDLTWMKRADVFHLKNNQQYQELSIIFVNLDNLEFSYLPSRDENSIGLNICIDASGSKLNFIQQIKTVLAFVNKNNNSFSSITLRGFNQTIEKILNLYAKKHDIIILDDELCDVARKRK